MYHRYLGKIPLLVTLVKIFFFSYIILIFINLAYTYDLILF